MKQLFQRARDCGFLQVIVWGSFPTAKQEPSDFDIAWIVRPGVNKDSMRPGCLELVESERSRERFGSDVLYWPFAGNDEMIQRFATDFGYDYRSMTPRGTLLLDL